MKKLFIAATIAAASFAALADGEPYANPQVGSGVTRAQVAGELQRAAAQGQIVSGEGASVTGMQAATGPAGAPMLSRAQVRQQLEAALRNGEVGSGEFGAAVPTRGADGTRIAGMDSGASSQ